MRSITTRTVDDGTTSRLYGQRVPKDHPQIEAVGTMDELNAALGNAKAHLGETVRATEIRALLTTIQHNLIALMGELVCAEADAARYAASKFDRLTAADVSRLDDAIAALEAREIGRAHV